MNDDFEEIELVENRHINKERASRDLLLLFGIGLAGILILLIILVSLLWLGRFEQISDSSLPFAAVPTLPTEIPTALLAPDSPAEIDPSPIPLSTPTLRPPTLEAAGMLTIESEDGRIALNEEREIQFSAVHPDGITNIQILDNGQTIFSLPFAGESEVQGSQQWVPLADGKHNISMVIIDGQGMQSEMDRLDLRVIDEEFMARNRPIFERVDRNVSQLRGLTLIEPIYPYLMGEGELKQTMRASGYTPDAAREDLLVLSAFDFAEPSYDLYEASIQYAGSSIAGFYDPTNGDFVLVSIDRDINALEELIYAHELIHALQDQHFDLAALTAGDGSFNFEEKLALRSLAEGEARLVEELYLEGNYFSDAQRVEIFNVYQTLYRPRQISIEPLPVLVEQFNFPYEAGREFVRAVYERGGWDAVNDVWQNPPVSTEQILHPNRYFEGDLPQPVDIKPLVPEFDPAWKLIREDVLGEFFLRQFLKQQLSEADTDFAALGWGGDRYHVYAKDGNDATILVWRLAWDNAEESGHFGSAFSIYADAAFGTEFIEAYPGAACRQAETVVCAIQVGVDWLIVRAPNGDLARQVVSGRFVEN